MKKLIFAVIVSSVLFLGACSEEKQLSTLKNVTYEAAFVTAEGDSQLMLKGEYIGKDGSKVDIDSSLPFKVELKDVSVSIKPGFKGYIYSSKATRVIGTFSYSVRSVPDGSSFITSKKELKLYDNLGFTPEELKEKTMFSF